MLHAQGYAEKGESRGWLARRSLGMLPVLAPEGAPLCAGVSSFAYQGTNSHVVLRGPARCPARLARPGQLWQRRRYWFQASCSSALPLIYSCQIG